MTTLTHLKGRLSFLSLSSLIILFSLQFLFPIFPFFVQVYMLQSIYIKKEIHRQESSLNKEGKEK